MAETKFTPGPWFYGIAYNPERGPIPYDYKSPGYFDNAGIIAASGETIVGCDEYDVFNSVEDAKLLCAAPELYAVVEAFGNEEISDAEFNRMRNAALAKARGEAV